jgi:hypothetical protein
MSADEYDASGPYDYNSIMHYRATMFSRSSGLTTIKAKQPVAFMGFMGDMSELDIWKIKKVYRCSKSINRHTTISNDAVYQVNREV